MIKEQNKKAPTLRFKGFTNDWEQRKLGEVANVKTGTRNHQDSVNSGKYPFFVRSEKVEHLNEYDYDTEAILIPGDGHIGEIFHYYNGKFALHQRVYMVNKFQEIAPYFLLNLFKYKFRKHALRLNAQGTVPSLRLPMFTKWEILIPNLEEQKKVGYLFKKLNTLITLQQRKLDLLKQLKKGLLQKMFADQKDKELVIRFKGFSDYWEQRKLGDVGRAQSGIGFPNKEQGGHQGIPFFKVSDMNNNGNEFEMKSSNNYVSETQITNRKWKPISEVPAVIFAKVGAALMLNRKRLVNVPFLIDNNTMAYIFSKEWDPYFGKNLFDTLNLPRYAQTGALPSFNGSDIENIEVMLPSIKEQQVIGQFFQSIDSLIALHQRKLDNLKILKKSLLQQMFI